MLLLDLDFVWNVLSLITSFTTRTTTTPPPRPFMDYSNWMGNLTEPLKSLPLYQLAIPGTHDSFSYSINSTSEFSPDFIMHKSDKYTQFLYKWKVADWSRTQDLSIEEQLDAGIRYFDFRLCLREDEVTGYEKVAYTCHGFYANTLNYEIKQIKEWFKNHPEEVAIIDLNHFYGFESYAVLKQAHSDVINLLNPIMYNWKIGSEMPSIKDVRSQGANIIGLSDEIVGNFFRGGISYIRSPWPNTDNVRSMLRKLKETVKKKELWNRELIKHYLVYQAILTPKLFSFIEHDSLKSLAVKSNGALRNWLKELGQKEIDEFNIVIADFINDYPDYVGDVVELNFKKFKN